MKTPMRIAAVASALLLAAGLATSAQAAHGGGGGHGGGHAAGGGGARGYGGGGTAHGYGGHAAAAPGHAAGPIAHGTAHGTAHWGYGYYGYPHYHYGGYYPYWGYGYGYPYWGWGIGFYWGWPGCYGYGCYPYGYPYAYDGGGSDDNYVAKVSRNSSEPATIVTEIEPSKAEVLLDGESVGFANDYNGRWDTLRVSPGKHTIEFRQQGHHSLAVELDARPGAKYTIKDTLEAGSGEDHRTIAAPAPPSTAAAAPPPETPAPEPFDGQAPAGGSGKATGRLRLHVDPADAAVYLDGQYLGLGGELTHIHGALSVASGKHRLEAVRPGYVTAIRDIEVGDSDLAVTDLVMQQQGQQQ